MTPRLLAAALATLLVAAPAAAQRRVVDSTATGSATLEGVVRDSAGRPVAGALVVIDLPVRAVVVDSLGRFAIGNLPSDTIDVSVQRGGYVPARFALAIPPNTAVTIAVKMLASQQLAPVIVSSQRRDAALARHGFYERGRAGLGKFYSPDDLARRSASQLSMFVREVPSMSSKCDPFGRNCVIRDASGCAVPIWIDGIPHDAVDDYDQEIPYGDVKAIEVYRRAAEVPAEFSSTRNRRCGALVIWTRFAR